MSFLVLEIYRSVAALGPCLSHQLRCTYRNPPYSGDHKEKCLEFCLRQFKKQGIPFFLLIPHYVAAKGYYRRIMGSSLQDMAYLFPAQPYEYDHPEGTGHEIPPFTSLWFCCVGREMVRSVQEAWPAFLASKSASNGSPQFVESWGKLVERGIISIDNRPNPKQRRKQRQQQLAAGSKGPHAVGAPQRRRDQATPVKKGQQPKKSSRYRGTDGKRTKKRF